MSNAATEIPEIDAAEASRLIAEGAYLLDVREDEEWDAGRAPEAHHIALGELEARWSEVPADAPVVCVCRGGGRSARAAAALGSVGLSTRNLQGGMRAWAAAGLPVVADDGPGFVL